MLVSEVWEDLQGTYLASGTQVGSIVSLDEIDFNGFATDSDVIRIRDGQEAYFDVAMFRRKAFVKGTVTRIGHIATTGTDGRSRFPIRIEVQNTTFFDRNQQLYIQAGIGAEAVIVTERGLSLIELVWEKIRKLTDFGVYTE